MAESTYALVASIARYWFLLLLLFIFVSLALKIWGEYKYEKRRARPSGSLGAVVVYVPSARGRLRMAGRYGLLRDNSLGTSHSCDIRLPKECDVARLQCRMFEQRGQWVLARCAMGDIEVNSVSVGKRAFLHHGDTVRLGDIWLEVEMPDWEEEIGDTEEDDDEEADDE